MRSRRAVALLLASACAGCGGGAGGATGKAGLRVEGAPRTAPSLPPRPRPVRAHAHETLAAALLRRTGLRARPLARSRVLARVSARTSFGTGTVLAVVAQRGFWLGVLAPELGNGRVGWVRQEAVRPLREQWSITVDLSARRVTLRHLGRAYRSFPVAVGTPAYPTPTGRFGVTDRLTTEGAGSPYGCCVIALSARQPHIAQDWPGGDRIAIHGTSEPGSIGLAASHGCLRAAEASMRLLIAHVPLGTPVAIRG